MSLGKSFNLFLIDGEVTGRIKCTLSNWTGLAYKISRSYLEKSKERQDLKQSGVYFLIEKNENGDDEVYIGQASTRKNGEGVLFRVIEHLKDNKYFSEVVILTTQNNSFGPTEISYLENRFTNIALETGRYKVRNGNEPNIGNVTEEKESELEEFIEFSKMVLGVLGYKVFIPILNTTEKIIEKNQKESKFYLSRKSKKSQQLIQASCIRTNEGFVVLKDSMIEEIDSEAIPLAIKELRTKCKANKEIFNGKLTKNLLFNSPSYAAAFVLGMQTNGRVDWKDENGITLKELENLEF